MKNKTLIIIETLVVTALLIAIVVYVQVIWSTYKAAPVATDDSIGAVEDPEYPDVENQPEVAPEVRRAALDALAAEVGAAPEVSLEDRAAALDALAADANETEIFE